MANTTNELRTILEDPKASPDEKVQADRHLKMLELRPLQQEMREEVLSRYK